MQVRSLDPPRMLCDLATGGCSTVEPAVLVELGDVVDRDLADRQLPGRLPELVGPEVMSPAVNEV